VGYGDFGAVTTAELLLSLVWMIFGVGFYSFVIGNLTSIIANENANSETLYNKLKALEEFAKKTKLPEDLHFKIKQFLENNYNELFSKIDEEGLLHELPTTLREEVLFHQFGGLQKSIELLRRIDNHEFVWTLVQWLRKIKVIKDDVIYREHDFSEDIYFIKAGRVKLYSKNLPFASYKEGEHFGDNDVIHKENRDGKAVAQTDCTFYSLHKDHLEKILDQFPEQRAIFEEEAARKKEMHGKRKNEAQAKAPIYGRKDILARENTSFSQITKKERFGFDQKV